MTQTVCCTFDLDFTNYADGSVVDELEHGFEPIKDVLQRLPDIKTTWFIRLDSSMRSHFGDAAFAFRRYDANLRWLRDNGHEVAWHHHAYRNVAGRWVPEDNEEAVVSQLRECGRLARNLGLEISRMGWGQHTNATLCELAILGFRVDSSAIPRPNYSWDPAALRDWSRTGQDPYYPSRRDYRVGGTPHIDILEIPISTTVLPRPTDTVADVLRYIDPCYEEDFFRQAVAGCRNRWVVLISHPYQVCPPVAGSTIRRARLCANLEHLVARGMRFATLGTIASEFRNHS